MKKETTKEELAEALLILMKTMPLSKITIADIAKKCGVSRQTFYRHFLDKYDLVNWYFEIQVQKSFVAIKDSKTLLEALCKKFQFIDQEFFFFKNAFEIDNPNSLILYDYNYIYHFYKDIIESKTKQPIDQNIDFILSFYCHASIDMTVDWVRKNRPIPPNLIAKQLVEAMPVQLEHSLLEF